MGGLTPLPALKCEETEVQRGESTQLASGRLKLEPRALGSQAIELSLPMPCSQEEAELLCQYSITDKDICWPGHPEPFTLSRCL